MRDDAVIAAVAMLSYKSYYQVNSLETPSSNAQSTYVLFHYYTSVLLQLYIH
jgi:hypothetical protein